MEHIRLNKLISSTNSYYFLPFILVSLLLLAGCTKNDETLTSLQKPSRIGILLDEEIKRLDNKKDELRIIQRIVIDGKSEEKEQDAETVKKALQSLKEMDLDRVLHNSTSFEKNVQKSTSSQNRAVFREDFILKKGEKSPISKLTVYYDDTSKNNNIISGIYILKNSNNKLYTSSQSHELRFKENGLWQIEINGSQKIIFSQPVAFKSIIQVENKNQQ